jgi:hypothetical protein
VPALEFGQLLGYGAFVQINSLTMSAGLKRSAHLTLVAPDNEKCTVQSRPGRLPRRKPNAEYRSREHLTEREVGRLIEVVKDNRWVTGR